MLVCLIMLLCLSTPVQNNVYHFPNTTNTFEMIFLIVRVIAEPNFSAGLDSRYVRMCVCVYVCMFIIILYYLCIFCGHNSVIMNHYMFAIVQCIIDVLDSNHFHSLSHSITLLIGPEKSLIKSALYPLMQSDV